jgi:hypothetical protein
MQTIVTENKNESMPYSCIEACTECYQTCLQAAMNHCLNTGGKHVAPEHFRMMMDCVEICKASVSLQLSSSTFSFKLCNLCAEVCDACADDCEKLGGMDECVKACRECADSCRKMVTMNH